MAADPGVVLVLPERESPEVKGLARNVRTRANASGLDVVKTFRAKRGSVAGEEWVGPVQFLTPGDAHQLYKRVHRERLLVVAFTTIFVRRDPSRDPAVRREALELSSFVEHKAVYELVRGVPSVSEAFDRFAALRAKVACDGEGDARCLPLHVFTTDRLWPELVDDEGRRKFRRRHGGPREWTDDRDRLWARAERRAFHGREVLEIMGCQLGAGMHWDVSMGRGSASRVTTANEVWKLAKRGYVNVYPDGHIRVTDQAGAQRVWTESVPRKHKR